MNLLISISSNSSSGHQRSNLAPQSMQWAIRSREANRTSGVRLAGSSGLVFIDPTALRRSTAGSAAVATASQEPHTMATTASCLARAFGIVIRQISELLGMIPDYLSHLSGMQTQILNISYSEAVQLQMYLESRLKTTWDWILTVMDSTEAQLRFGASLTNSADPSHPLHPLHSPHHQSTAASGSGSGTTNTAGGSSSLGIGVLNTDNQSARREFLTYCLSLMRAHNSEHRDSLPVLDVTALKHIAYVLDAIIYYMRSGTDSELERNDSNMWNDQDENENEDNDDDFTSTIGMETDSIDDADILSPMGRRHGFFQRSESTLCLGCPPPDPFNTTLAEGLPLADQPHLLQPNARREELFGMPKQPITLTPNGTNSQLELPPTRLGLSPNSKNNLEIDESTTTTTTVTIQTTDTTHNDLVTDTIQQQVAETITVDGQNSHDGQIGSYIGEEMLLEDSSSAGSSSGVGSGPVRVDVVVTNDCDKTNDNIEKLKLNDDVEIIDITDSAQSGGGATIKVLPTTIVTPSSGPSTSVGSIDTHNYYVLKKRTYYDYENMMKNQIEGLLFCFRLILNKCN